jgi:F-type H+-transporting ATPase subunit epsilon
MSGTLTLRVTTPLAVTVDETGVTSIRAEDASGCFGILPGHADFLTVLGASVLRWHVADARWHYCALRGGILRIGGGSRVEIACREAVRGDDLAALEALIEERNADRDDAVRRARAEQTRLHANAIRGLMQRLGPNPGEKNSMEQLR